MRVCHECACTLRCGQWAPLTGHIEQLTGRGLGLCPGDSWLEVTKYQTLAVFEGLLCDKITIPRWARYRGKGKNWHSPKDVNTYCRYIAGQRSKK